MFSFRTTSLHEQEDLVLKSGKLAVLCNQTAWHPDTGEYLFETAGRKFRISKVFYPEDGFFCEGKGNGICGYSSLEGHDAACIRNAEGKIDISSVLEHDALVIEFQDNGSRFSTWVKTLNDLFLALRDTEIPVYVVDRINPSARQIEGSSRKKEDSTDDMTSLLPHRHGLTPGETASMFHSELNARFPLHVISYMSSGSRELMTWSIPQPEGIGGLFSTVFHTGQYLWKGTNISFGEGTGRTYEMAGAPFIDISDMNTIMSIEKDTVDPGVYMRRTCFVPYCGRYAGQMCGGFQLLPSADASYHSLIHGLRMIRSFRENLDGFMFGTGETGMEQILSDPVMYGYANGDCSLQELKEHIKTEEQKWIRKAKKYLLYDDSLLRVK